MNSRKVKKPAGAKRRIMAAQERPLSPDPVIEEIRRNASMAAASTTVIPQILQKVNYLEQVFYSIGPIQNELKKITDEYGPYQQMIRRIDMSIHPLTSQVANFTYNINTLMDHIVSAKRSIEGLTQSKELHIDPLLQKMSTYDSEMKSQFAILQATLESLKTQTYIMAEIVEKVEKVARDPVINRTIDELMDISGIIDIGDDK